MCRPKATSDWMGAAVWVGILLAAAALSARPAAAQVSLWAAVAVSPSKLDYGATHASLSRADAESGALQSCQQVTGATDCKIVESGSGECVALATTAGNAIAKYYAAGQGLTREGAAATALAECTKESGNACFVVESPCSSDDGRWASPLPLPPGGKPGSVDPNLVGLWKLDVGSGIWVWQISANGAYTLHSEALDGTVPNAGTFTASKGMYTLHATSTVWDDQGTYTMQGSTAVVMTGKLGTGTWVRVASDPTP
jgi:hypothetical protein